MSYIASASAIEESGLTTEGIPGVMIAVTDAELASQIESSNSSPAGTGSGAPKGAPSERGTRWP